MNFNVYNINNLYFAKCRKCIEDYIMSYYENDVLISPRPDYVDYYTILYMKNDKLVNIYDSNIKYEYQENVLDVESNYKEDIIFFMIPFSELSEYIVDKKRMSYRDCCIIEEKIMNEKKLKLSYGYKK